MTPRLVLASTSRYRAELLGRLYPTFEQVAPGLEEQSIAGEDPRTRAERLAAAKAGAVAKHRVDAIIIGSDQVAALGDTVLHKPGTFENARQQLHASSGNTVDFFTALCVLDSRDGSRRDALDHTRVQFRVLPDREIGRYLATEHPLDCAGSFKSEGAGIALLERIETRDPTALVGLPLIALARVLRTLGFEVP